MVSLSRMPVRKRQSSPSQSERSPKRRNILVDTQQNEDDSIDNPTSANRQIISNLTFPSNSTNHQVISNLTFPSKSANHQIISNLTFPSKSGSTSRQPIVQQACYLLKLPSKVIFRICKRFLDRVSCIALGLTCKALYKATSIYFFFKPSLYIRTLDANKKCLGHLLTTWMAPKYSFDHSWGKFLRKKHHVKNETEVEEKWIQKESWGEFGILVDKLGAVIAYKKA